MRSSMAYFAGAGTVVAAIVGGVGGGLLIADMVSPKPPKQGTELTHLERRTSPQPIQATPGPSEPVQYLAAPQPAAASAAVAAVQTSAKPPTEAGNVASIQAQPAGTAAAPQAAAPASQPATPAAQPATPAAQPVALEQQPAAAEDAVTKARDADVKRSTDKRRAERRQHWAERRRYRPREEHEYRPREEHELRAVEERVREETGPRREFVVEPARSEMPLIRLFGQE